MKKIIRYIIVAIITWEAKLVLSKYKPQVIAVTGSVGKTSTKDAIYSALEDSLYIRKTEKSFNSEIGIPLTILGCDSGWNNPFKWSRNILEGLALIFLANHYPKWLILEVGTDRPGDIQEITSWLKPDIVVITTLPEVPVHVENFASQNDIILEKKALANALKKDGTLILDGDDKITKKLKKEFSDYNVILFGVEPHNDIYASHTSFLYNQAGHPIGVNLHVEEEGSCIPIRILGRIGNQQIYPVLSAFAVAKALGMGPIAISKALEKESGPNGRMKILDGYNGSTIIDDSYNSSPTALRAAISALKKIKAKGKKIAVLGDMLQLGKFSTDAHKKAGVQVAGVADVLITVGIRAKEIASSAREAGFNVECIREFDFGESREAGLITRAMLEKDDVVLVKGSQNDIRLEKAIKEILEKPQDAKKLLVRQEDEWLLT